MTLRELVEECFPDLQEVSGNEDEVRVKCPFCSDSEYRLGINTREGKANCFRGVCDFRTSSARYLWGALCQEFGVDYTFGGTDEEKAPAKTGKQKTLQEIGLMEEYETLWNPNNNDAPLQKAFQYLSRRGITREQMQLHRIGYCHVGKYSGRVVLPVFRGTRIVGYVTRTIFNQEPKYLNSDGLKYLYNVPPRRERKRGCVLAEGPFDALSLERALSLDFDCLGRLGSDLTPIQLEVLGSYQSVVIWPDPDSAGVKGATQAARDIRNSNPGTVVYGVLPEREQQKDPGDMSPGEIKTFLAINGKPWTKTLEQQMKARVI